MRPILKSVAVAVTIVMVPALALAGNQQVATEIAKTLQESGQLKDYRIGVKYQDGTAWLKGSVKSKQQMSAALKIVFQMPGINRVVNDLELGSAGSVKGSSPSPVSPSPVSPSPVSPRLASPSSAPPQVASGVQQVPVSFEQRPVRQVAALQPQSMAPAKQTPMQTRPLPRQQMMPMSGPPIPVAYMQPMGPIPAPQRQGGPIPAYVAGTGGGVAPARYDQPNMPNYAWPSYSAYPNYASLTYPRQYSPTAWPYIGPFYPYPQVPLGWRKVTMEWDDGWWMLDFKDH